MTERKSIIHSPYQNKFPWVRFLLSFLLENIFVYMTKVKMILFAPYHLCEFILLSYIYDVDVALIQDSHNLVFLFVCLFHDVEENRWLLEAISRTPWWFFTFLKWRARHLFGTSNSPCTISSWTIILNIFFLFFENF